MHVSGKTSWTKQGLQPLDLDSEPLRLRLHGVKDGLEYDVLADRLRRTRDVQGEDFVPFRRAAQSADDVRRCEERRVHGAVEAPFIVRHGDWYYLFVSYDLCCRGPKSTYKVVVGRSDKVTGPYVDAAGTPLMQGGGTVVASGNDRYPGVGHCAVVSTKEGEKMLFHAYDRETGYNAVLLARTLVWDRNGWPSIQL